ncbi:hypothetical protein BpHYR1_050491 [Brachionus plicatilis]|uniref:Uncharacterized protein n=1 Tax=Brachionus plicatilis TaxID=10195 RepID=A0A3M7T2L1_BRAPC|nr:hypothetical protein BpHYR1_050491 [Brachionus plicatilis]
MRKITPLFVMIPVKKRNYFFETKIVPFKNAEITINLSLKLRLNYHVVLNSKKHQKIVFNFLLLNLILLSLSSPNLAKHLNFVLFITFYFSGQDLAKTVRSRLDIMRRHGVQYLN